jgi:hypothetical protein
LILIVLPDGKIGTGSELKVGGAKMKTKTHETQVLPLF